MQCPKCNKEFSDEFIFCPICGEEIVVKDTQDITQIKLSLKAEEYFKKCEKCGREISNGSLCYDCRQPNKKSSRIYIGIIISGLILILIGIIVLPNYYKIKSNENKYISKAESLISEYKLKDAKVNLEYYGIYHDLRRYDLIIESSDFENLDDKTKYNFVKSLDGISVSGAYYIVLKKVVSNSNEYTLSAGYENVLDKNYKEYFSLGNKIKPVQTAPTNSNPVLFSSAKSDIDIWVWSQKIIEDNLKSPSSAKFPRFGSNDVSIKNMNGDIFVQSYVDADNGFGAKIRTPFIIRFIGGNMDDYELAFDE